MSRIDVLRVELLEAVVNVVDQLDDRGIPVQLPELPLIGRVPIVRNERKTHEAAKEVLSPERTSLGPG